MAGVKGKSGKDNDKPILSPKVQEQMRAKINGTVIINQLIKHIKGDIEMKSTQVTAALGLLRKVAPDLAAMTISGDKDSPFLIKDISSKPFEANSSNWLEKQNVIEGEVLKDTVN